MAIDYTQIKVEPSQYHRLRFVDGYSAKVVSKRPTRSGGRDVWYLILEPSEELVKRYKLQSNEKFYEKLIDMEDLITLNDDPAWTEHFCLVTWDGKETPASRKFRGYDQIQEIKRYKENVERLKAQNAYLKEQLDLAKTDANRFIKENYSDVIKDMGGTFKEMWLKENKNG